MWRPWSQSTPISGMNTSAMDSQCRRDMSVVSEERPTTRLVSATHKLPQVTWFLHPSKEPTKLILRRRRAATVNEQGSGRSASPEKSKGQKRKYSGQDDTHDTNADTPFAVGIDISSPSDEIPSPSESTAPKSKQSVEVALHKTMCAVSDLVPLERKRGGCTSTEVLCQEDALNKTKINIEEVGKMVVTGELTSYPSGETMLTSTMTYAEVHTPGLVEKLHKPSRSFIYPTDTENKSTDASCTTGSDVTVVSSAGSPVQFPLQHGTTEDCTFLQGTSAHVTTVRCTSPPLSDIALPSDAKPGAQTFHQVKQTLEKVSNPTEEFESVSPRPEGKPLLLDEQKFSTNHTSFADVATKHSSFIPKLSPSVKTTPLAMLEQFCNRIPGSRDNSFESKEHATSSEVPYERQFSNILVVEPKPVTEKEEKVSPISLAQDEDHEQLVVGNESNDDGDKSLVIVENDVTQPEVKPMEEVNAYTKASVPPPLTYMHQLVKSPPDSRNNDYEDNAALQSNVSSPIRQKTPKCGVKSEGENQVAVSVDRVSPSPPLVTPPLIQGFPFPFVVPTGDPRVFARFAMPIPAPVFPPGMPMPYPMMQTAPFWPPMGMGIPMPMVIPPNMIKTELSSPSSDNVSWSSDVKTMQGKDEPSPIKVSPPSTRPIDTAPPRKRRRVTGPKTRLNPKAVELMRESFLRDRYPNAEEKERLAREGGLTVQQVNGWFTNYRRKMDYGRIEGNF